jgi:NitT/TauT family transport system substrate-binding protein
MGVKKKKRTARWLLAGVLALSMAFLTGCGQEKGAQNQNQGSGTKSDVNAQTELKKVRIGNFGTTCEAPLFAAYENGFFKEEGLDAELIQGDHAALKEALATGKIDATDGVLMQWIKPVEQGLNIKFTAGIHTGCLQILVPQASEIASIQDFKGKTIGVPAIGGGPMNMVSRLLAENGIDIKKDVTWKAFPAAELELALTKGEVDIISLPDPLAQIFIDRGSARSFLNMAKDEPFVSEYCCLVVINGTLLEKDPETAAAITRAILKGAKWVSEHPQEAAKLEADKKYVPGDAEVNGKTLADYNYLPSVTGAEEALLAAAKEMKVIGILDPATDAEALARNSFVRLEGVE